MQAAPAKKLTPAAYLSHAFITALAVFLLLNLALLQANCAKEQRDIAEVLVQAKQESDAGLDANHSWAWWLTRLWSEQSQSPDVVVFGSSLLGSAHASIDAWCVRRGVDVLTHRQMIYLEEQLSKRLAHQVSVFSLGSPGEMVSDYYVLSKALFAPQKKPRLVVATIAPRDFIDSTLVYPAATDYYKFFANYIDLSDTNRFAFPDFFARLGAEMERLPLKRIARLLTSCPAEKTRNYWVPDDANRIEPGKSIVPPALGLKQIDNTREYRKRFSTPNGPNYACEMAFLRSWLADLRKQGIAVTVVCMPTTEANRKLLPASFWQRFRRDVAESCRTNQADWFDMSESPFFQPSDYLDTVHMNAEGAVKLFPAIAEHLAQTPSSSSILKPASAASQPR
jgi:hypothetical protein